MDPISKFRDTALEISRGNFNASVKTELKDEIGQLADVFNEMVKKLNALYENLDKQVRERTAELQKTNKNLEKEITEHMHSKKALLESEKKYKELSITDGLTKLYNSRHFFNQLDVFRIWGVAVMGFGFAKLYNKSTATGMIAVGIPWLILVSIGAALIKANSMITG